MQVLTRLLVEQFHEVFSGINDFFFLFRSNSPHFVEDFFIVFGTPHVRDFTSIQDVVEILQKAFLDDLSIGEDESNWFVFTSSFEKILQIVFPLRVFIVLGNLNCKYFEVSDTRGQSCQALPSGTAHTDQKSVSSVLPQNTADLAEVQNSVFKEDKVH